jgi:hypothetical protein
MPSYGPKAYIWASIRDGEMVKWYPVVRNGSVYICCGKDMRIEKISLFSSAALERIYRPCETKYVKNQRKAWSGVHRITHPAPVQGESANNRGGAGPCDIWVEEGETGNHNTLILQS